MKNLAKKLNAKYVPYSYKNRDGEIKIADYIEIDNMSIRLEGLEVNSSQWTPSKESLEIMISLLKEGYSFRGFIDSNGLSKNAIELIKKFNLAVCDKIEKLDGKQDVYHSYFSVLNSDLKFEESKTDCSLFVEMYGSRVYHESTDYSDTNSLTNEVE